MTEEERSEIRAIIREEFEAFEKRQALHIAMWMDAQWNTAVPGYRLPQALGGTRD